MVDLLVRNGTVVTMNDSFDIIEAGSVAIDGSKILDVGPVEVLAEKYDADRVVDADGHAVLPGFVTPHTHVSDILLRGIGTDRQLYDWLYNVKIPGTYAMTSDEHAVASALYCREAIRSGLTTFVEFGVGGESGYGRDVIEAKFDTYGAAGIRNAYAHSFMDRAPDDRFAAFVDSLAAKEPAIEQIEASPQDTDEALDATESLIEEYHGTRDSRQSIWPAPIRAFGATPDGLRGAVELAEKYDVMTTAHVAESPEQEHAVHSGVDYLHNAGFLGDRTVLAHCVHLSERDVRLLGATDTRVSHNLLTNLGLGDGIAPVPDLLDAGVTVGVGIDNTSVAGTANMLAHLRAVATVHKGARQDAGAITAEKALEMVTIDAARAIGRGDELGSIEPGKYADLVLVDLERNPPVPNVPAAVVYQSQGVEVDTVLCHGEIIMDGRRVHGIEDRYPDLDDRASEAARDVSERVGFTTMRNRPWTSRSPE